MFYGYFKIKRKLPLIKKWFVNAFSWDMIYQYYVKDFSEEILTGDTDIKLSLINAIPNYLK